MQGATVHHTTAKKISLVADWLTDERTLPGPPWPLNAVLLAIITVGPLLLAAFLLKDVSPVFWLLLIADLVVLFGVALATFRTPALFIAVIIIWFALQRIVVALLAPHISADLVRLLLTYKEGFYMILVAVGACTVAIRYLRGDRALPALFAADAIALAFLGWLALIFISDPHTSTPEITYLRRFAAPLLLYIGGRLLIARRDQFVDSMRLFVVVAVGVAAFGFVERFVLDISFWRDTVDATTFYGKQVQSGLLPQNWTVIYRGVPDGIFIALPLQEPVRRLVSTYLEPTTLSSLLALALLLIVLVPDLAWNRSARLQRIAIGLSIAALGIAAVATLSRGGMVTFVAAAGFVLAVRWIRSPGWRVSIPLPFLLVPLLLLMAMGAALTSFDDVPARATARDVLATRAISGLSDEPAPMDTPQPRPAGADSPLQEIGVHPPGSTADAASKHLRGLTSGLEEMLTSPLGRGLGATGNWSGIPGSTNESTLGVIAAQLGIAGFVLYSGFFAALIIALVAAAWNRTGIWSDVPLVLAGAMLGLFIVSCVSESTSGILGNAFYLLFAGWALSMITAPSNRLRLRLVPERPADSTVGAADTYPEVDASAAPNQTRALAGYGPHSLSKGPILLNREALVTIVILNWNSLEDTRDCLQSLGHVTYSNRRIVVVDNGSALREAARLRDEFHEVHIIESATNIGFAAGANLGIRFALAQGSDYVLLLNNDTTVDSTFLTALVDAGQSRKDGAAFCPKAYFYARPEIIYSTGGSVSIWTATAKQIGRGVRDSGQFDRIAARDYADGVCMLIPRAALEIVGLLDEDYFAYWEETDWCTRARAKGLRCYYIPEAKIWHKAARVQSPTNEYHFLYRRNALMFVRKRGTPVHRIVALLIHIFFYGPRYFLMHPGKIGRAPAELKALLHQASNQQPRRPFL
ncbi:MAG: glycosyltransferase family 2 protein [Chloroflexi bacterium]|nr:MAG: glycosyltransferase family 2 protein [Chloroflexota bacterium]